MRLEGDDISEGINDTTNESPNANISDEDLVSIDYPSATESLLSRKAK